MAKRIQALAERPTDPMSPQALRHVLRAVHEQMLRATMWPETAAYLERIAAAVAGGAFTSADVQHATGLARSQAGRLIGRLLGQELAISADVIRTAGRGRPAQSYRLTGQARLAVGA